MNIIILHEMNKISTIIKKIGLPKITLLVSILISINIIKSGAYLRWLGFERIPDNKIFDERDYALQGLSIRKSGIPMGWSSSGSYENIYQVKQPQLIY